MVYSDDASFSDMEFFIDATSGSSIESFDGTFTLKNSIAVSELDDQFCQEYTCSLTMQDGSALPSLLSGLNV